MKVIKQIYSIDDSERGMYLCVDDNGNTVYKAWHELHPEYQMKQAKDKHTYTPLPPIERDTNGNLYRMDNEQHKQAKQLIKSTCCNYSNGTCIVTESDCTQCNSKSLCCKHFRWAVLPNNKMLELSIIPTDKKANKARCKSCKKVFYRTSNRQVYCSDSCRIKANRKQSAERMRKKYWTEKVG